MANAVSTFLPVLLTLFTMMSFCSCFFVIYFFTKSSCFSEKSKILSRLLLPYLFLFTTNLLPQYWQVVFSLVSSNCNSPLQCGHFVLIKSSLCQSFHFGFVSSIFAKIGQSSLCAPFKYPVLSKNSPTISPPTNLKCFLKSFAHSCFERG